MTIRIDDGLRRALEARARARGLTLSAAVREALESVVVERPLGRRIDHLRRRLRLAAPPSGSQRIRIRERNWRG